MIDIALPTKNTSIGAKSNVIDFYSYRNKRDSNSTPISFDEILDYIIGNPDFETYLKETVEGIIYSQWATDIASNLRNNDDPFDSIYLADLQPDTINKFNITFLNYISNQIKDKSDEIIINDGWDD